jgi:hypothetical protein
VTQKPIDVNSLLQDIAKAPKRSGTRAKKVVDTTIRTYTIWFRLDRKNGDCENPNCEDPRRGTEKEKSIRIAYIREKWMCMYCFVAGYGGDDANTR